jgi:hypothetical protein
MCLGRAYFEREENKWKGNKDGCTDFSSLGHEGNWRVNNKIFFHVDCFFNFSHVYKYIFSSFFSKQNVKAEQKQIST